MVSGTTRRRGPACTFVLLSAALPVLGGATPDAPDPTAGPVLLSPTLGRPVFVAPGGQFTVVAQMPQPAAAAASAAPAAALISARPVAYRHVLALDEAAAAGLAVGQPVRVSVPADVPAGTCDLELRWGGVRLLGRHCVAVGELPQRIRLVHLSNMNLGEPSAPAADARLIDEVNLVAPTLIIATGDLLDAAHESPATGWAALADFFSRFDAPALIACGDHDDPELYSRTVAPSPAGAVELGPLRGIVLYDTPAHPAADDPGQMDWFERLPPPDGGRLTFVLAHDECPSVLRAWQRRGVLAERVAAARLGLWFAGGHRDWDGREYRSLIDAAAPLLFVRTHQASPATLDGATGLSHYRILDVADGRVTLAGTDADTAAAPSTPVGRLNVSYDGPADGTAAQVAFTVVNNHPFALDRLRVRVPLARAGGGDDPPWCLGAELESVVAAGPVWDCRVRFDLPDKGALRAVLGSGPAPPLPGVQIAFELGTHLRLRPREAGDGIRYWSAAEATARIHLHNRDAAIAEVTPLVRLDGAPLAYSVVGQPGPPATAYRLRLPPAGDMTLQLDLSALTVAPGRRALQVYLRGPAAWRPACWALDITAAP